MLMPAGLGQTYCTMDLKTCPDGSFVSRTGPDCRFAACPGEGSVYEGPPGDPSYVTTNGGWVPWWLRDYTVRQRQMPPAPEPRRTVWPAGGLPPPGAVGPPTVPGIVEGPPGPEPFAPGLAPAGWIGENLGTVLLVAGGVAFALFFLGARKGRY